MKSINFDRLIYGSYMRLAIEEAEASRKEKGIPIGSIIVKDNKVISRGHNRRVQDKDPIMHAELCCIQDATRKIMDLTGATLYSTNMPCYLCAGAIIQFGISKVVAGESETFPHARHLLESNGVEVVDLDLVECKSLVQEYITINRNVWGNASNNNQPKNNIDKYRVIIPYTKQSYVNFYQYPPPLFTVSKGMGNFVGNLDLNKEMSGEKKFTLFISIPYCRSKCYSCPFFKNIILSDSGSLRFLDEYLQLLIKQINSYANTVRFSQALCGAVYWGGGTASVLNIDQIRLLMDSITGSFQLSRDAEITLEVNPFDVNQEYLEQVVKTGINRLSIGLQSFSDKILRSSLNSPHNSESSLESVKIATKIGFKTVNVDLLYGVPGQTRDNWQEDVEKTISLAPQSITIYRYVIHQNSTAEKMIRKGRLNQPPKDKTIYSLYLWARQRLIQANYHEGRLGCFSLSQHEQKYSQLSYNCNCESIGIGAGAYSLINGYVFRASEEVKFFQKNIEQNIFQIGDYRSLQATPENLMERYIMNNLFAGCLDRHNFVKYFHKDSLEFFPYVFAKLWRYKLVVINANCIKVTRRGKKYLQNILYEFYSDNFKPRKQE